MDKNHNLGANGNLPKIVKLSLDYPYCACQPCKSQGIAVATHKK
jgi:hypothetical protein